VSFTLTNSALAAADNMILNMVSGTDGAYYVGLAAMANGSCTIVVRNLTGGALAEAVAIRFTVLKGTLS
jgi:hypothetical protein